MTAAAKKSGWYSLDIGLLCQWKGCKRRATVEVFDDLNNLRGRFCKKHEMARLTQSDREFIPPKKPIN